MNKRSSINYRQFPKLVLMGFLAFSLSLTISCRSKESPPSSPNPRLALTSTPTNSADTDVLTERQRLLLTEFGSGFTALERDWDSFHKSYSSWFLSRNILTEPDMEKHLGELVIHFQQIKYSIFALPTNPLNKSVGDKLFETALTEEKAIRAMRDTWRPGDGKPFQNYEENLIKIEEARFDIKQRFDQILSGTEPQNRESLEKFYNGYRIIEGDWDKFHEDYDNWKATGMKEEPPSKALPAFVSRYQSILKGIYGLQRPLIGQSIYDLLIDAGEREERALSQLNKNYESSKEAFNTYEAERLTVEKLRNQLVEDMEELRLAGLDINAKSLKEFSTAFKDINKKWYEFHSDYDSWRNPGNDTRRDAISRELNEYVNKFNSIVELAHGLPQGSFVRPLSETAISAVEKEQQGLLQLQKSWKSYDSTAWHSFNQEQQAANKMRRQIRGAFIDLLAKYNLSIKDVIQ